MDYFNQLINSSLSIVPDENSVSSSSDNWVMLKFLHVNVGLINKISGIEVSGVKGEELIVFEFIWFGEDFLLNLFDYILFSIVWQISARVVK